MTYTYPDNARAQWKRRHNIPNVRADEWDIGAYDDIITTIKRQGFYDCLGGDLIAARFDNGNYPILIEEDGDSYITSAHSYASTVLGRPARVASKRERDAATQQALYEWQQRQRQLERERIASEQWQAEEQRRIAEAALSPEEIAERDWLRAAKRQMDARLPPSPEQRDAAVDAAVREEERKRQLIEWGVNQRQRWLERYRQQTQPDSDEEREAWLAYLHSDRSKD